MEGGERRGTESESTGSTHTHSRMGGETRAMYVTGMRSTEIQGPPWLLIIARMGRNGDFPDETQQPNPNHTSISSEPGTVRGGQRTRGALCIGSMSARQP